MIIYLNKKLITLTILRYYTKSQNLLEKLLKVIDLFSNVKKSDFDITVNGIDCFFNKDYDVLKMDVRSNKLNELNELCKTLPHTSTYPDYKPHITIAYLLKGNGSKYMNPTFQMKMNNIDKLKKEIPASDR